MNKDIVHLAEGISYEFGKNDINDNILVIGSTGSGKTMSVVEPRLLHTYNSSLVIPITKRKLFYRYSALLKERGYKIIDLNLIDPASSPYGYNPFLNCSSQTDILNLARSIIGTDKPNYFGETDRYWNDSSSSALAALMMLYLDYLDEKGFGNFLSFYNTVEVNIGNTLSTSVDKLFDILKVKDPTSSAPRLWATLSKNAPKTASCVYSTMNNSVDKIMSPELIGFFKKRPVDLKKLGEEKTALFISTSPINEASYRVSNILYWDLFKTLLSSAEKKTGHLKVPVHIIADDFACGSVIPSFSLYISMFREVGVSVTILLQSISQLESLYGSSDSQTIANNCDTYIYMGTLDISTGRMFAEYVDRPIKEILSLPISKMILVRRGEKAVFADRYDTPQDEIYKNLISKEKIC